MISATRRIARRTRSELLAVILLHQSRSPSDVDVFKWNWLGELYLAVARGFLIRQKNGILL